jgi:hypothetical protein
MRKDAEFDESYRSGEQLEIHAVAGLYVGPGEDRVLVLKVPNLWVFEEGRAISDQHMLALF